MRAKSGIIIIIVIALLAAAGVFFISLINREGGNGAANSAASRSADGTGARNATTDSKDGRRESMPSQSAGGDEDASADDEDENINITGTYLISGRMLDGDGQPAADVRVVVRAVSLTPAQGATGGMVESVEAEATAISTLPGGEFSLQIARRPNVYYTFQTESSRFLQLKASWGRPWLDALAAGDGETRPVSLGELKLQSGGVIFGKLLLADGRPFGGSSIVVSQAAENAPASFDPATPSRRAIREVAVDPVTGEYKITGLALGPHWISGGEKGFQWKAPQLCVLRGTEPLEFNLQFPEAERTKHGSLYLRILNEAAPVPVEAVAILEKDTGRAFRASRRRDDGTFEFMDIPAAAGSLRVDDPAFLYYESEPLALDGHAVEIAPRPAEPREVRIDAVDASTGEPVPGARVKLHGSRNLQIAEGPAGENISFAFTKTVKAVVTADGFLPRPVYLESWSGGARTERVELLPSCKIEGVLRDTDGRTPAPGIFVNLQNVTRGEAAPGEYAATTSTSRKGKFIFNELPPGRYLLNIDFGRGRVILTDFITLSRDVPATNLVFNAPRKLTLRGKLVGGEKAVFHNYKIQALELSGARPIATIPVEDDGAFELSEFGDIPIRLELLLPRGPGVRGIAAEYDPPFTVDLGELRTGQWKESPRIFELAGRMPGMLSLEFTLPSGPAPYFTILAMRTTDGARHSVAAITDSRGRATLGPIPPGDIVIEVLAPMRDWAWAPPLAARVAPGENVTLNYQIPVAAASPILEDPEGVAIVNETLQIQWSSDAAPYAARTATTDADGRLTIEAPSGNITISGRRADADFKLLVPWGPGAPSTQKIQIK